MVWLTTHSSAQGTVPLASRDRVGIETASASDCVQPCPGDNKQFGIRWNTSGFRGTEYLEVSEDRRTASWREDLPRRWHWRRAERAREEVSREGKGNSGQREQDEPTSWLQEVWTLQGGALVAGAQVRRSQGEVKSSWKGERGTSCNVQGACPSLGNSLLSKGVIRSTF